MIVAQTATLIVALLTAKTVPLVNLHADPAESDGKVIATCGEAYGDNTLYLRGWMSGRSRGGMLLDRSLTAQGYVCLRVRVVRVPVPDRPDPREIFTSHPTVLPKGWQLKILKVLKRK